MNEVKFDVYNMCEQLATTLNENHSKGDSPFLIMSVKNKVDCIELFHSFTGTGEDKLTFLETMVKSVFKGVDPNKKAKLMTTVLLKSLVSKVAEEYYGE